MKRANNVDDAVTPQPEPDQWDERPEASTDTGKPNESELFWGRSADDLFAGAHAAAAALRKLRPKRAEPDRPEPEPKRAAHDRVGYCDRCERYVAADGWHGCEGHGVGAIALVDNPVDCWGEFDYDTVLAKIVNGEPYCCYHGIEVMKLATKGKQRRQPVDVPDEWRVPPGYDNYLLHSVTRALRRQDYDRVLPNGSVRHYPSRLVPLRNGAYSLTVDGVTSSRGVNALWSETFPEFSEKKKKPKKTGEWSAEVQPHRAESTYYHGLGEWLGEGGAGIETRPK